MSRAAFLSLRKFQQMMMSRWRPSDQLADLHEERRRRSRSDQRSLIEGLEVRRLFAVTPLPEVHGPVETTQSAATSAAFLNGRLDNVDNNTANPVLEDSVPPHDGVDVVVPANHVSTITELTTTYGLTTSDGWRPVGNTSVSVDQFDTLGGTRVLVGVDVHYEATALMDFNFDIQNLDETNQESIAASGNASFTLTPDVGNGLTGSVSLSLPTTVVSTFGDPGDRFVFKDHDISEDSETFSLSDPLDLAAYIDDPNVVGIGTLAYALSSSGGGSTTFNRSTIDDAQTFITTVVRAEVTVTYHYLVLGGISGTKYEDQTADGVTGDDVELPGVTINLYDDTGATAGVFDGTDALIDTDVTDANGDYSFTGLLPGVYHVTETVPPGYTQSYPNPNVHTVTVDNVDLGDFETGYNFANWQPASKSGIKFSDINGDGSRDANGVDNVSGNADDEIGLVGFVIRAYADDGDGVLEQAEYDAGAAGFDTTDATGAYSITGLTPGDYVIVEVQQAGYSQTAPGTSVLDAGLNTGSETLGEFGYAISLISNEDDTGNNFGNQPLEVEIELKKYANGADTDCVDVAVGDTVNYTYVVTNTGNVAIDITNFVDDNATPGTGDDFNPIFDGGDTDADGLLDTNETWLYHFDVTAIAGEHTNIATIFGNGVIGVGNTIVGSDSDSDEACYETPTGLGGTATMGFWANKNGQAVIKSAAGIGNALAGAYSNLFGAGAAAFNLNGPVRFMNLSGQSASNVAAYFQKLKDASGPKPYAQLMANVLAAYFNLNVTPTAEKFGFGDGDLLDDAITLTSGQAAALGLPTNTNVGDYLARVNTIMAGNNGVIPSNLFIIINNVSDLINNMNHV